MSGLVRHADPVAFLAAARPLMARDEAAAAAYASWAGALLAQPAPAEHVYLATYARGPALGAALQRRDGPVVLESSDPEAAVAFALDLAEAWPGLPGVVAAPVPCAAFARVWRERTGRAPVLRFRMRHHRLTEVAAVPAVAGTPRVAAPADAGWLVDAQLAFLAEARVPDDPQRVRGIVPGRIERGELWVWDDGGPVAFAGWTAAADDTARIAPVYTDPARRRRGHGSALVAALARALLGAGRRRLFLLTDLANPTSNALYARIGFVPLTELHHVDFVAAAASAG
jgi:GNAT superfamily N-acetyltransferase